MSHLRKRAVTLAIKSSEDTGTFSGLGSVFNNVDSYGDVVVKGAFEKSLARHKSEGTLPSLLWQHKADEPIGIYTKMEENDQGLELEGQYALDVVRGKEAHALTKMKALRGLSIGFTIPKNGMAYDEEKNVYLLKEIDLWEVSVVTFPANTLANITDVRSSLRDGNMPTEREFEAILRDAGFTVNLAKACVAKPYRDLLREADKKGKPASETEIEELAAYIKSLETAFRS